MQVSGKVSQSVSHVKRSQVIQPRIGVALALLMPAVTCSRNGSDPINNINGSLEAWRAAARGAARGGAAGPPPRRRISDRSGSRALAGRSIAGGGRDATASA